MSDYGWEQFAYFFKVEIFEILKNKSVILQFTIALYDWVNSTRLCLSWFIWLHLHGGTIRGLGPQWLRILISKCPMECHIIIEMIKKNFIIWIEICSYYKFIPLWYGFLVNVTKNGWKSYIRQISVKTRKKILFIYTNL